MDIDLRSYFPEFTRSVVLPDGVEYSIRELVDLPVRTFNRIVADEKSFPGMPFEQQRAILVEHLQTLLVLPITKLGRAMKGEKTLEVPDAADLRVGDAIHVSGGLYFERNFVASVGEDSRSIAVEFPWRFDATEGGRVFRGVRADVLDDLSMKEFGDLVVKAKTPAEAPADPPKAASELTS